MAKKVFAVFHPAPANKTLNAQFFVEEQSGTKWRKIPDNAGPYSSRTEAEDVASRYSLEHHVKTRVVGIE